MKHIKLTILLLLACLGISAQTLQQGRNYWYGICCMETGERDKAVPYLEKAASKKIYKAYRALGEYYLDKEDYQPAITNLEAFVKGISADKELHDAALEDSLTQAIDSLRVMFRMLRNTSRVCIIDSFVVSKDQLFESYVLGESTGSFYPAGQFFEAHSTAAPPPTDASVCSASSRALTAGPMRPPYRVWTPTATCATPSCSTTV